mgnify:CR=1 FL=1
MCRDCGCDRANEAHRHDHSHDHLHDHAHDHSHEPPILRPRRIALELSVLAKNDRLATENRQWLHERGVRAINLISSPGAGKTRLLEKTVERLNTSRAGLPRLAILTGDQEQDYDAQRLRTAGAEVRQINTHSACHLDAAMIGRELSTFVRPGEHRLLIIENVGNLVCPAAFDLGESNKVALLSTTEGEDKPSKYPLLFQKASLIVLTKIDLIPHLDFSLELCTQHLRRVNPTAPILMLSARTGEGMDAWLDYLTSQA